MASKSYSLRLAKTATETLVEETVLASKLSPFRTKSRFRFSLGSPRGSRTVSRPADHTSRPPQSVPRRHAHCAVITRKVQATAQVIPLMSHGCLTCTGWPRFTQGPGKWALISAGLGPSTLAAERRGHYHHRWERDTEPVSLVTEKTVKNHISGIFLKLQVNDRTEAALLVARYRLAEPGR